MGMIFASMTPVNYAGGDDNSACNSGDTGDEYDSNTTKTLASISTTMSMRVTAILHLKSFPDTFNPRSSLNTFAQKSNCQWGQYLISLENYLSFFEALDLSFLFFWEPYCQA
jgi:hypothetical protein